MDQARLCVFSHRRILATDEVKRADRFRFAADRRRFIMARGLLRRILGRYLHIPPEQVKIEYGQFGKPVLAAVPGRPDLHFNVSHSSNLVLFAMAHERQVGIDLERIRPLPEAGALVDSYFSSAEQSVFRSLSAQEQLEAFYRLWTRKEALVKANGQGLALPPHDLRNSLVPDEPSGRPAASPGSGEASGWTLLDLLPAPGYVGTLAAEGQGCRVSCWHWTEEGVHDEKDSHRPDHTSTCDRSLG